MNGFALIGFAPSWQIVTSMFYVPFVLFGGHNWGKVEVKGHKYGIIEEKAGNVLLNDALNTFFILRQTLW